MDSEIKKFEEAKRERCFDPVQRWQAILAAIRFAGAKQPVSRNSKQRCLEKLEKFNRSH